MASTIENEFSRVIDLAHSITNQAHLTLTATPTECAALSNRFDLARIDRLQVDITITEGETSRQGFFVDAHLTAKLTQKCIVTLKDVPDTIDTNFKIHILEPRFVKDVSPEMEEEEDIEFSEDGFIDIGEISAQYLYLSLNPYPRAEGVTNINVIEDNNEKESPFSALNKLKSR